MKYIVSLRGPSKSIEFNLEARNIKEASEIIKSKYPRHRGYSIKEAH
jgi:hypothetical protein